MIKENFKIDGGDYGGDFGEIEAINFINLSKRDSLKILDFRNHEEIRKNMYTSSKISDTGHFEFIKTLKKSSVSSYWAVRENEEFIGVCSLSRINLSNKNSFFGIYKNPLSKKRCCGVKIMAMLKYIAFVKLSLHSLHLEVLESNKRAVDFYLREGFMIEGRLREFIKSSDRYIDAILMVLLEKDI